MKKIIITGASGLVGRALSEHLCDRGDQVLAVSRQPGPGGIAWDVSAGKLDPQAFDGTDAVVHLAGENIAAGRWTPARRAVIRDSRIQGTRLLVQTLAQLATPPPVLVSASAIGFYGPEHAEPVDETSPPGTTFLAGVCRDWEAEAAQAESLGVRVVRARIGVVLTPAGGALARMLPAFKAGLGGPIGGGGMRLGWIALDDVVGALAFLVDCPQARGAVNLTAPELVSNREFAAVLAQTLGRPAVVPTPALALKLALGELATETVLGDFPVRPARLQALGYAFQFPELAPALTHLLGGT